MNPTEKQIRIAAKMYELRDTAKRLFPELYAEHHEGMTMLLKKIAERDKVSILQSLTSICKEVGGDGIVVMLLTAAAVDLMDLEK